jgi:hypothetical protein
MTLFSIFLAVFFLFPILVKIVLCEYTYMRVLCNNLLACRFICLVFGGHLLILMEDESYGIIKWSKEGSIVFTLGSGIDSIPMLMCKIKSCKVLSRPYTCMHHKSKN